MNTILYNICKLRKSFENSSLIQNAKLQFLSGNIIDSIPTGTITDGLGNSYTISEALNGNVIITRTVKDNLQDNSQLYYGTKENFVNVFNKYINGIHDYETEKFSELHFKNFLLDASKGEKTNEMFAVILDKYTTNSRASATDICNIIASSGVVGTDVRQLQTVISASSDDEGKVSNYAILSILKNLCYDAKDRLDEDKISMDDTKIFYVSNFLATAITTVVSLLVEVVGMLLTAVNAVVGMIIAALGFLINAIGSLFEKIDDKAYIQVSNPLSTTTWFDGPTMAKVVQIDPAGNDYYNSVLSNDKVVIVEEGSFSTCLWMNDQKNICVNRFLGMNIDVERFGAWLFNNKLLCNLVVGDVNSYFEFSIAQYDTLNDNPLAIPDSVFLTTDERIARLSLSHSDLNNYMYSAYLLWCAYALYCGLVTAGYWTNDKFTVKLEGAASTTSDSVYKALKASIGKNKALAKRALGAATVWNWHNKHNTWIAPGGNVDLTELCVDDVDFTGEITSLNDFRRSASQETFMYLKIEGARYYCSIETPETLDYVSCDPVACYLDPDYVDPEKKLQWKFTDVSSLSLSSVPTDRMLKFAAFDRDAVLQAAAAIAIATTVVLVAGTVIVKQIKKAKWKRQYDRKAQVQAAKEAYDHAQTAENFDALYKAQKSYNFKAKLFGWESYDAANDWFDAPELDDVSTSGSTELTLQDIVNLIH